MNNKLIEVMDKIETEARRRVKEGMVKRPEPDLDEAIVSLIKERSLSPETISYVLKQPSFRICKRLRKLEKWGHVKRTTRVRSWYWQGNRKTT